MPLVNFGSICLPYMARIDHNRCLTTYNREYRFLVAYKLPRKPGPKQLDRAFHNFTYDHDECEGEVHMRGFLYDDSCNPFYGTWIGKPTKEKMDRYMERLAIISKWKGVPLRHKGWPKLETWEECYGESEVDAVPEVDMPELVDAISTEVMARIATQISAEVMTRIADKST